VAAVQAAINRSTVRLSLDGQPGRDLAVEPAGVVGRPREPQIAERRGGETRAVTVGADDDDLAGPSTLSQGPQRGTGRT
jgi:hypothetical protein